MTASCVYLLILRSFSDHLFYRAPLGNCLFHLQVTQFQLPHTVKKCFYNKESHKSFSRIYTRRRSSHSKAFMYLKFLKIIREEVNLLWSCEMLTCKLTKIFHTSSFMRFAFIFLEYITITVSRLQFLSVNISGM